MAIYGKNTLFDSNLLYLPLVKLPTVREFYPVFQKTDLITKCLGAMFVGLGMSSMLLRVLFSTRPSTLKQFCREKEKKEKTVFDTR